MALGKAACLKARSVKLCSTLANVVSRSVPCPEGLISEPLCPSRGRWRPNCGPRQSVSVNARGPGMSSTRNRNRGPNACHASHPACAHAAYRRPSAPSPICRAWPASAPTFCHVGPAPSMRGQFRQCRANDLSATSSEPQPASKTGAQCARKAFFASPRCPAVSDSQCNSSKPLLWPTLSGCLGVPPRVDRDRRGCLGQPIDDTEGLGRTTPR